MTGNDGEIAHRYLERGSPEAAYVWARQSNEHTAQRYSALGTAILKCFGVKKVDAAIKTYTKAVELDPRDFSLKLMRGIAYKLKTEGLIRDYVGDPKTGSSHMSFEVKEMIDDTIGCAKRDFLSVFEFSKSPGYRRQVARRSGELHFLETMLGEC